MERKTDGRMSKTNISTRICAEIKANKATQLFQPNQKKSSASNFFNRIKKTFSANFQITISKFEPVFNKYLHIFVSVVIAVPGARIEFLIPILVHFDVRQHPVQLIDEVRRHPNLPQPCNHHLLFLSIRTHTQDQPPHQIFLVEIHEHIILLDVLQQQ
jgi:hypothetical protein